MRFRTCSLIATLVAALGLLASPTHAQNSRSASSSKSAAPSKTSKAKKSSLPSRPASDAAARQKAKNYDFLADEIDGARILPDQTTIFGREVVVHRSLIRLRTEFISEILKSAE